MRGTIISNFFNFKNKYKVKHKTYKFDRARYELILLKQLEDNKIFYNGIIYESNFLHYHKLDAFVQKIYALRDEYILRNFQVLSRKELKRLKKFNRKYNFINQEWMPYKYPYKMFKNVDDILKEGNTFNSYQIKVLVNAFRYTFHYSLDYDLLDPFTRRRPLYKIDKKYDFIDADVRVRNIPKNEVKPYKYFMVHPSFYQCYKNPVLINIFFEDWFYIIGWRALKRVFPIFELMTYPHYTDSLRRKSFAKLHDKERVEPVFQSSIFSLQQGTTMREEWVIEYDEKKKFDEYDINCKTNSYYTRYKRYNEFYHIDYPENKKFKTTLIHDFTEDEIKENYDNMLNNTQLAKEKWDYVMTDSKYKNAVFDFFARVEQHQFLRRRYEYPSTWYLDFDEDSNEVLEEEINDELFQLLNDPQYILVLPLVDAYFEIYRPKGWWHEDESFLPKTEKDDIKERKFHKHLEFFDMSYERVYLFYEKSWLIDEYIDHDWDEYVDDHMDEEYTLIFIMAFLLFWFAGINLYFVIILNGLINFPLNFQRVNDLFATSYEYYFNKGTKRSYYGLELRKARMRYHSYRRSRRIRIRWREYYLRLNKWRRKSRIFHKFFKLPYLFFKDGNYSFYKQRTGRAKMEGIMDHISTYMNIADEWFDDYARKLRFIGIDYGIYRFRVIWVEDPMPVELQLIMPKIRKLVENTIGAIFGYIQQKVLEFNIRRRQREHHYIRYMAEQRYYKPRVIIPMGQSVWAYDDLMYEWRKRMTREARLRRAACKRGIDINLEKAYAYKRRYPRLLKKFREHYDASILDRKVKKYARTATRRRLLSGKWLRERARKNIIRTFKEAYGSWGEKKGYFLSYKGHHGSDSLLLKHRQKIFLQEYLELREDRYDLRTTGISRRGRERDHKLRRAL